MMVALTDRIRGLAQVVGGVRTETPKWTKIPFQNFVMTRPHHLTQDDGCNSSANNNISPVASRLLEAVMRDARDAQPQFTLPKTHGRHNSLS